MRRMWYPPYKLDQVSQAILRIMLKHGSMTYITLVLGSDSLD